MEHFIKTNNFVKHTTDYLDTEKYLVEKYNNNLSVKTVVGDNLLDPILGIMSNLFLISLVFLLNLNISPLNTISKR